MAAPILGHYVYRILGERGETVYVGKGKGRRLEKQRRRFKADGEIIKEFRNAQAAYEYERDMIAKFNPPLNQTAGGGGTCKLQPGERIASKVHVARMLCNRFWIYLSPDKAADIRKVAGYDRAWSLRGPREVAGYGKAWASPRFLNGPFA